MFWDPDRRTFKIPSARLVQSAPDLYGFEIEEKGYVIEFPKTWCRLKGAGMEYWEITVGVDRTFQVGIIGKPARIKLTPEQFLIRLA